MSGNDELLLEAEDSPSPCRNGQDTAWRILVVDDDPEVHVATDFALQHVEIFGHQLQLLHTSSAAETLQLLEKDRDFSVILLDVVMETEDAGLRMVRQIRERFGMSLVRIILRTGQPGYAPELTVFNDYDINDYRTKSELTRTRLITSISSALRSYQQLFAIAENRRGLELIVDSSTELIDEHEADRLAANVLEKICALLRRPVDALLLSATTHSISSDTHSPLCVLGARGIWAHLAYRNLDEIDDPDLIVAIQESCTQRQHRFGTRRSTLYIGNAQQQALLLLSTTPSLSEQEQRLLEVFASNIAANLGSTRLFEQLHFTAYHDSLTGLHNRNRFILDLDEIQPSGSPLMIALIGLEDFHELSAELGQEIVDALVLSVVQRLDEQLGSQCLLARISADIFAVVGPEEIVNPGGLYQIFSDSFSVLQHTLPVSVILGLCRIPKDKLAGTQLLKRASMALNRARKDMHSSHVVFGMEMEERTRHHLEIIHHLSNDFALDALSLWYQPQIDLASGKMDAIEALLRWPRDGGGFVQGPDVFVPLAEHAGLMIEIGRWVLNKACADFATLREYPGAPLRVAVNIGRAQFRQHGLSQEIAATMGRHGLGIGELDLEITEAIATHNPRIVLGTLLSLKTTGARIVIDDFGTGFSALTYLQQLPVDALKIDQSFIAEIAQGHGGLFAETITGLGTKLDISTIAEGVETAEQAGFLRGLGCTCGQGFFFAPAMPLEELKSWMSKQVAGR